MTDGEIPVALDPDERVDLVARMDGALVVLTDHRVVVQEGDRTALDVDLGGIRRIEFDLERGRAATLILVPHDPRQTRRCWQCPTRRWKRSRRRWGSSAAGCGRWTSWSGPAGDAAILDRDTVRNCGEEEVDDP